MQADVDGCAVEVCFRGAEEGEGPDEGVVVDEVHFDGRAAALGVVGAQRLELMLQVHGCAVLVGELDFAFLRPRLFFRFEGLEDALETRFERGIGKLAAHFVGAVFKGSVLKLGSVLDLFQSAVDGVEVSVIIPEEATLV